MNHYLIDVRDEAEYGQGHIEGALNISLNEIQSRSQQLLNIPKDAGIILYCASGNRAGMAQTSLKSMGYTNVVNGVNQTQVLATYPEYSQ